MPKKPPYLHTLRFICTRCDREQQVEVHDGMGVKIGTVLKPYPGGGGWGVCRFCKGAGLRALEEPPQPRKGPVGWKKIPKK